MAWEVEYAGEFVEWWSTLTEAEQIEISAVVELLEEKGPRLPYPYTSGIKGSRQHHMRELRIQYAGDPYRIFYAFDPRRVAILLIGGNKSGDDRWYDKMVPIADRLYDDHLRALRKEGLIDG